MTTLFSTLRQQYEAGMSASNHGALLSPRTESTSLTATIRAKSVALLQKLANDDEPTPTQCAEWRALASRD